MQESKYWYYATKNGSFCDEKEANFLIDVVRNISIKSDHEGQENLRCDNSECALDVVFDDFYSNSIDFLKFDKIYMTC